jgi:hypothetical protein
MRNCFAGDHAVRTHSPTTLDTKGAGLAAAHSPTDLRPRGDPMRVLTEVLQGSTLQPWRQTQVSRLWNDASTPISQFPPRNSFSYNTSYALIESITGIETGSNKDGV